MFINRSPSRSRGRITKLPVLMAKTLFSRHFSGPEAETQTIKSCFPSTRSSVVSPTVPTFNYKSISITRREEITKKSSGETRADKYPSIEQNRQNGHSRPQKMCFQFTANDFRLFCCAILCSSRLFVSVESISSDVQPVEEAIERSFSMFCRFSMQIPTIPGNVCSRILQPV